MGQSRNEALTANGGGPPILPLDLAIGSFPPERPGCAGGAKGDDEEIVASGQDIEFIGLNRT